jgi:hypothetical protein
MKMMTRGLGERTQTRNIKNANYPQKGLLRSIVPDATNVSMSGANVVSIRVGSKSQPIIVNSNYQLFYNRLSYPFLNMQKVSYGMGLQPYSLGYAGLQTGGNKAWGGNLLPRDHVYEKPTFISDINSFNVSGFAFGSFGFARLNTPIFSINSDNLIQAATTNFQVIKNIAGGISYRDTNYFDVVKGGVNTAVSYKKGGGAVFYVDYKGNFGTYYVPSLIESIQTHSIDYRVSGVEPLGTLSYTNTDANHSRNAAWLLNQRTQYQRKFNPLKNLGI